MRSAVQTPRTHTFEKLERTTKKCNAWNLNKNPTRHANDNCFMAFRMDVRLPSSFLFCLSFFHTFFRVFRYIFSNRLILIKKHCNCSLASILMCVCFKKKTCFQRLVHREKRAIPIFGQPGHCVSNDRFHWYSCCLACLCFIYIFVVNLMFWLEILLNSKKNNNITQRKPNEISLSFRLGTCKYRLCSRNIKNESKQIFAWM